MSKSNVKPAVFFSARLPSTDENFDAIVKIVDSYDNRNRAVLDALRILAGYEPLHYPKPEPTPPPPMPTLEPVQIADELAPQFDILNDRLSIIMEKLMTLTQMGFSPQTINAAMGNTEGVDPALQDEIRAQFLANNT